MQRRGIIVRREIPAWIDERLTILQSAADNVDDLRVEGRDATGPKSEIPWVRIHSRSLSPNAQTGWYVVYLFEALGDRVYLSLGHGSTQNVPQEDGSPDFRPRSADDIALLMEWAQARLGTRLSLIERLTTTINLSARRSRLGPAYEKTALCAFPYPLEAIPDDEVLLQDLLVMLNLLDELYEGENTDPAVPGRVSEEVTEALTAIESAAGQTSRGRKQGWGLSTSERKAVELRAMDMAREYLLRDGWTNIVDTSANHSYDLLATKAALTIKVEVKGTTSSGEHVLLTRNEVELHCKEFPNNALIVVKGIVLVRDALPVATGGVLVVHLPWELDRSTLEPLGYEYPVPSHPPPVQS
jgi:hypothetical protein